MARSGKHNKSPFSFQLSRSLANSAASFQLLIPAVFIRLRTTLRHVCLGLPGLLFPSGSHPRLTAIGDSLFLNTCPRYFHLLFSITFPMSSCFVVLSISSFVLLWYHLIFKIRLVYVVWNTRRLLNCSSDRKSTRLNSSHPSRSRMPSSA